MSDAPNPVLALAAWTGVTLAGIGGMGLVGVGLWRTFELIGVLGGFGALFAVGASLVAITYVLTGWSE